MTSSAMLFCVNVTDIGITPISPNLSRQSCDCSPPASCVPHPLFLGFLGFSWFTSGVGNLEVEFNVSSCPAQGACVKNYRKNPRKEDVCRRGAFHYAPFMNVAQHGHGHDLDAIVENTPSADKGMVCVFFP